MACQPQIRAILSEESPDICRPAGHHQIHYYCDLRYFPDKFELVGINRACLHRGVYPLLRDLGSLTTYEIVRQVKYPLLNLERSPVSETGARTCITLFLPCLARSTGKPRFPRLFAEGLTAHQYTKAQYHVYR